MDSGAHALRAFGRNDGSSFVMAGLPAIYVFLR
jgi:hypothetical protein